MAMRDLVNGGASCTVPGSSSSTPNPIGSPANALIGSSSSSKTQILSREEKPLKPPFVIAKDDTKPVLQDPLWRSDPTQAEEAVLRLPTFNFAPLARD